MAYREQYINLHSHGVHSILDGHGQYKDYAERAVELGQPALAITEHGNIAGLVSFYEACKEAGLQFIPGIEAYQARKSRLDQDEEERAGKASDEFQQRGPYHLTILAKNQAGYQNLIKLSSRAFLEGFYVKGRTDYEIISDHSEGLVIASGCLSGALQQALLRDDFDAALAHAAKMQEIVGRDNYFIEVMNHGIPEEEQVVPGLIEISKKIDAPLLPTGDTHYVNREDYTSHDHLLCVNTKSLVSQENRFKFSGNEFYLKSYDEMRERFPAEWLDNSMTVFDMVEDIVIDFETKKFPHYEKLSVGQTASNELIKQSKIGFAKIYGDSPSEAAVERLNHELGVIQRMGYEDYMLIVADIVKWCADNNILTGPGRGSAAGSIVSYCLGITKIDPIAFDLSFERFLVEGKVANPDIDLDVDTRHRDDIIEYIKQTYGEDRIANIITFGVIGARSAIRDASRVLGHPYSVGDELANMTLPAEFGKTKSLRDSLEGSAALKEAYEEGGSNKEIIDAALGIEGIVRQEGIHAAGVVIGPGPLVDHIPLQKKGSKKPVTTQWNMDVVDKINLLKMDLLNLKTLDVISDTLSNIEQATGSKVSIYEIPLDDKETYNTISQGKTTAVFQLESSGMKQLAQAVGVENMDNVAALVALYRPGPMGSNMHKMYADRKNGRARRETYHPSVEPYLADTQQLMIYQEQVMNISQGVAGFSILEADGLRKAIGKKIPEELKKFGSRFVSGCVDGGVPKRIAEKIFSDIEFFGHYSFNRAHAISYGFLAYATAYLKTHYPTEYMAAALSSAIDDTDKLKVYLNECANMGVEVRAPSVKNSELGFTILGPGQIAYGLLGIKSIGPAVVKSLLKDQDKAKKCTSVAEWMRVAPGAINNKGKLEALINAGALDDFVGDVDVEVNPQQRIDLLNIERNQLGIYITGHPLDTDPQNMKLLNLEHGKFFDVLGVLTNVQKKTTRAGATMYTYTLDRPLQIINVVVFPKTAEQVNESDFVDGRIVSVKGRAIVERNDDGEITETKLIHMGFNQLNTPEYEGLHPIVIEVDKVPDDMTLSLMCDRMKLKPGSSNVYLNVVGDTTKVVVKLHKQTKPEEAEVLRNILYQYKVGV